MRYIAILGLAAIAAAIPLSAPLDGPNAKRDLEVRNSDVLAPVDAPAPVEKRSPAPQTNTINTLLALTTAITNVLAAVTLAAVGGATAISGTLQTTINQLVATLQAVVADGVVPLTQAQITAINNAIALLNGAQSLQAVITALNTLLGAL